MEEIPVTRAYLESLTTGELIKMADNYGIDIPPDLDRIFIIEELLDSVSQDDPADTPDTLGESALSSGGADTPAPGRTESAPLPKQYNISFIQVMIRDPQWAFVFWEIKASDKEQFEKANDFDGYYLKVSPLGKAGNPPNLEPGADPVFTIPVKPEDNAWYLGLGSAAAEAVPDTEEVPGAKKQYKVELCAGMKGEEISIVTSHPFNLPALRKSSAGGENRKPTHTGGNSLVNLSGYGDFHVLRGNERVLRTKRSGGGFYEE